MTEPQPEGDDLSIEQLLGMMKDGQGTTAEAGADVRTMAKFVWSMYNAFKNEGFSDQQAFDLSSGVLFTQVKS